MRFGVYLPTFACVAGHGRDPATLRYGHLNFVHLVDASDREGALRLQRPIFERVMGTHRTFENLQQSNFLGTTREIVGPFEPGDPRRPPRH